ncbi:FAD-dependent oxidoreductase [Microbacterium sp. HD4P20]|uniref:FAD-dependent oxidoreductase n=1 Tax=Microbacterium sp. HD4P20 TaxID=2864874 RepID=UPI001C640DE1|nr:FAD-dependent oxidoreductase [Microbacterium sp. HD4P20]MCP2635447.1 FAD-dependent oxidoreductase [Microbacterium sp. HD4P20]
MTHTQFAADLPVSDVDVLVAGGGCAGFGAALAAARGGARTLLVEQSGFIGGILTRVGNPWFDGVAHLTTGRIALGGIPIEVLQRLGLAEPEQTHLDHPFLPIDPEAFKHVADQMLMEQHDNLDVLFHTSVAAVRAGAGRVDEVVLANKAGLSAVRAKVTIDATGDGDVAAWAGAPVERSVPMQPLTLHFRVGNVEETDTLTPRMREVVEDLHETGAIGLYFFHAEHDDFAHAPDELVFNITRIPGDGTDPADLTAAEMRGRKDAHVLVSAWRERVPEFRNAYLIYSGPSVGVRETRRIVGDYQLTEDDIRSGRRFEDAVLQGVFYVDVHPSDRAGTHDYDAWTPDPYDIPFRTLLPRGWDDLLVAGRCHSATRRAAGSSRVTATAMAMGQAAGTAAALAVASGSRVRDLDTQTLQNALRADGVILN